MTETLDTLSTGGIRILQPRSGYRYSLDSLILPFFLDLKGIGTLLEVGAGAGVLSLVLACRCPDCRITAVEIQERLYRLLERNVTLNGLEGRVRAVHADVRKIEGRFEPRGFDCVCSNPPFRKAGSGRLNPHPEKAAARHEISLSLPELVAAAAYLLKPGGRFALVHLPERLADLMEALRARGLEPRRMRTIHSFPESAPVLLMMEAVKGARPGMRIQAPFVIYRDRTKTYSREMQAIYDFRSAEAGG